MNQVLRVAVLLTALASPGGFLGLPVQGAAPAQDAMLDAVETHGASFTLTADLAGATREFFEPIQYDLFGQTLWWRWTAPDSGVFAWDSSGSPMPVAVSVLSADGLGQWDLLAETYRRPRVPAAGSFGGTPVAPDPKGSFVATAGTRYWIRLDGVETGGSGGVIIFRDPLAPYPVSVSFTRLVATPPANDTFAGRNRLALETPVFEGSLAAATAEPGEPTAHAAAVGRTLWWEWTATESGTARVRTSDTNQAPLLAIHRRSEWQGLESIASSATEYGNECSRFWRARGAVEWDTTPGESYFLQVDGFPEFDRDLPFHSQLEFTPAPTNDLLSNPLVVEGLDWSVLASNEGATGSPADPQVPELSGASSIWYRWMLPSHGLLQVTTNEPTRFAEPGVEILPPGGSTTTGSVVDMYLGPCGSGFADLHPLPLFFPILSVFHRFGSIGDLPLLQHQTHGTNEVWAEVGGSEVWIQMDGPQGATGRVPLNGHLTPPPPNDLHANRILLPSAPVRVTGRSAGATADSDETFPEAVALPPWVRHAPRRTVWWEWQAPTPGLWALRIGAGTGHYLAIYRGSWMQRALPTALTASEPALFQADAGEVFQIGAYGMDGLGGNIEFRIQEASAPRLTQPTLQRDGADRLWWDFALPAGWDLPFQAEASSDLRTWTPIANGTAIWQPGAGSLRIPFEPEVTGSFLRLRVGPP